MSIFMSTTLIDFNPRSLTGATQNGISASFTLLFQSTLPCGSDGKILCQLIAGLLFQSTLPHGSDVTRTPEMVAAEMFQSTLPRWSDHLQRLVQDNRNHFNPRSIAGATGPSPYAWFAVCISIHAPLRERLVGRSRP